MKTITDNGPVVNDSDVVFLSVKPGVVPTVLDEVKSIASNKLFISVAMGITIEQIENVSLKYIHRATLKFKGISRLELCNLISQEVRCCK